MPSKESFTAATKSTIIPWLTQEKIKDYAHDSGLYERGFDYYKRGAVSEVTQIEKTIKATVFGSSDQDYNVTITFDDNSINKFYCTCPYDGGVCKHAIAVLLYCLYNAEKVIQTQSLDEALAELDQSQLCMLIETIARSNQHVYNKICMEIDLLKTAHQSSDKNKSAKNKFGPIDPEPYKQEILNAFHNAGRTTRQRDYYSDDMWDGSEVVEKLSQIVLKTEAICMHGEGYAALRILEAITEVCVDECSSLEDEYEYYYDDGDGHVGDIFSLLSHAWCQALLTTDLSPEETTYYSSLVESWQNDHEIKCTDAFNAILLALKEGWHDMIIQKALTGDLAPDELELEPDREIVIQARLEVLLWQQRLTECVHFARYSQFILELVEALLRQGSKDEALAEAEKEILDRKELLLIAKKFAEHHEPDYAMRIAQKGLVVEAWNSELPDWLSKFAELHQCIDLSRQAAVVSCKNRPTLERYLRSLQLTPSDQINETKEELIDYLVKHKGHISNNDLVNIFFT